MRTPVLLLLGLTGSLCASAPALRSTQFNNPGAYTSGPSAGTTDGHNILFFGNSFTISAANPPVHSPSYGGARGVPELVRQVAIAAGRDAPFVKNVYHQGRGYDYHVDPGEVSLGHIDEPKLDGETWDFVIMQGYSTRPTAHPYTGNAAAHRRYGLQLFEEVRAGSTNHVLQSPGVVPVLYQTWARQPGHWLYDTASPHQAGSNIAIGVSNWTLGPVFESPWAMTAQVRSGYEQTRRYIDAAVPGTQTRIAPAGDAWMTAGYDAWRNLYSADYYHAASLGDLTTALTIYGTVYGDAQTYRVVLSGALDPVLAAIGVDRADALVLTVFVDSVLAHPPAGEIPDPPPVSILVDFSEAIGRVAGPEDLPVPGRHYNTITSFTAGAVFDAVDTRSVPTPVDVVITDAFAGETSGGATGTFNGQRGLGFSLYQEAAQLDSFFVGSGSGYSDTSARVEVRELPPGWRYTFRFHGSRNVGGNTRTGHYCIGAATVTLNAEHNLNLTAEISGVRPDANGTVEIEIHNGGVPNNFAYLGVLEIVRELPRRIAPIPR